MTAGGPPALIVDATEAARLFEPLLAYRTVALAVSGGGDSLALLHLVARWRAGQSTGPTLLVLTVDHGLRAEAAAEAAFVAAEAATLGLPHEALSWTGSKPQSGLPAAAREARYRLMLNRLALETQPAALVTAHTQDDQAETLLMRLARGSGVDGLAGMAPARAVEGSPGLTLVRPLLGIAGERLRATLTSLGRTWVEDPTNKDLDQERPRLRAARPVLDAIGLDASALARSAGRLRHARDALDWATRRLADDVMTETPGVAVTLDRGALASAPRELTIRLLGAILRRIGGEHPDPRLIEIERLADMLRSGPRSGAYTLAGTVVRIEPDDEPGDHPSGRILIVRERGRQLLPVQTLAPGQSATWDRRFHLTLPDTAPSPVVIRSPTEEEWSAIRRSLTATLPWPPSVGLTCPIFESPDGTILQRSALGGPAYGGTAIWAPWLPANVQADALSGSTLGFAWPTARGLHVFASIVG